MYVLAMIRNTNGWCHLHARTNVRNVAKLLDSISIVYKRLVEWAKRVKVRAREGHF